MSWPIDRRFNIFIDPPEMEVGHRRHKNGVIVRQPGVMSGTVGGHQEPAAPSYSEVCATGVHSAFVGVITPGFAVRYTT